MIFEKRYTRRLLVIIAVSLIIGVIYYLFSPSEVTFFPKCPFHSITGLDCPGCGSQRTLHHLAHFEIKKAFISNPLLIMAIPYMLTGIYFEYFGGKENYPRMRRILFGKKATVTVLIVVLLFWIGRNLV
ncbi:MAG: DUF2752 domain-containing protein [Prevotella sp.]|nr:DUF2752 domain-containing protein [Prevotella sp.]